MHCLSYNGMSGTVHDLHQHMAHHHTAEPAAEPDSQDADSPSPSQPGCSPRSVQLEGFSDDDDDGDAHYCETDAVVQE